MIKRSLKEDGKDKYRKKKYIPKFKRDFDGELNSFKKAFGKIPKDSLLEVFKFLEKAFRKNPDLKLMSYSPEALKKPMIELGNKGANLSLIHEALKSPDIPEYLLDGHPFGLQLYEGELSPRWNQLVEEYKKKKRKLKNKEKAVKGAISMISSLDPIPETVKRFKDKILFINAEAKGALEELERVLRIYFDAKAVTEVIGYCSKWGLPVDKLMELKFKKVTQKSHLKSLNRRMVLLVDELKRIGYSDSQAYTKTGELLSLAFPHIWKDKDDRVRSRYTYSKKKK